MKKLAWALMVWMSITGCAEVNWQRVADVMENYNQNQRMFQMEQKQRQLENQQRQLENQQNWQRFNNPLPKIR
jgi:hypothetical protein